jgi:transposase
LAEVMAALAGASGKRWGQEEAQELLALAQHSAASTRAVVARSLVVRTLCLHLLDLRARLAELEAAIAAVIEDDNESQRLQEIPGIGPQNAATIRAELGDVSRFSRVEQVIAYAGLEPRTHDSGRYAGQKRLSKRGPGALRHALSSFDAGRRALSRGMACPLSALVDSRVPRHAQ